MKASAEVRRSRSERTDFILARYRAKCTTCVSSQKEEEDDDEVMSEKE